MPGRPSGGRSSLSASQPSGPRCSCGGRPALGAPGSHRTPSRTAPSRSGFAITVRWVTGWSRRHRRGRRSSRLCWPRLSAITNGSVVDTGRWLNGLLQGATVVVVAALAWRLLRSSWLRALAVRRRRAGAATGLCRHQGVERAPLQPVRALVRPGAVERARRALSRPPPRRERLGRRCLHDEIRRIGVRAGRRARGSALASRVESFRTAATRRVVRGAGRDRGGRARVVEPSSNRQCVRAAMAAERAVLAPRGRRPRCDRPMVPADGHDSPRDHRDRRVAVRDRGARLGVGVARSCERRRGRRPSRDRRRAGARGLHRLLLRVHGVGAYVVRVRSSELATDVADPRSWRAAVDERGRAVVPARATGSRPPTRIGIALARVDALGVQRSRRVAAESRQRQRVHQRAGATVRRQPDPARSPRRLRVGLQ